MPLRTHTFLSPPHSLRPPNILPLQITQPQHQHTPDHLVNLSSSSSRKCKAPARYPDTCTSAVCVSAYGSFKKERKGEKDTLEHKHSCQDPRRRKKKKKKNKRENRSITSKNLPHRYTPHHKDIPIHPLPQNPTTPSQSRKKTPPQKPRAPVQQLPTYVPIMRHAPLRFISRRARIRARGRYAGGTLACACGARSVGVVWCGVVGD